MGRWAAVAAVSVVAAVSAVALGGDLPPLQVRVEAEVYTVLSERIEIRPGLSTSSVPEVQELMRLSLHSVPHGASVTLDGEPRGQTPLTIEDLALGSHDLVVRGAAHAPFRRRVRVEAPPPRR